MSEQRISRKDLFEKTDKEDLSSSGALGYDSSAFQFEFTEVDPSQDASGSEKDEDMSMSFNLFGKPAEIKLVDSVEEEEKWIKDHNKRADLWYMYKPTEEQVQNMLSMAVSGEDVIKQSTVRYPGLEKPWRVVDFTELEKKRVQEARKQKRRRPGKKSRQKHLKLMQARTKQSQDLRNQKHKSGPYTRA